MVFFGAATGDFVFWAKRQAPKNLRPAPFILSLIAWNNMFTVYRVCHGVGVSEAPSMQPTCYPLQESKTRKHLADVGVGQKSGSSNASCSHVQTSLACSVKRCDHAGGL